mmetsp:Transcript_156475/g.276400  ORF Transcript_156475/g.276400 Transcript_156475/m.276400 type:complete len:193 (-) Transcript_156475:177-755(-)
MVEELLAWRTSAALYGGAITCDMPSTFDDVSAIREVPDHQEVWADRSSDRSLIVEILERKKEVTDEQAVNFFLADLASANDAKDLRILVDRPAHTEEELPSVPADTRCMLGVCEQTVAKFNEASGNVVRVHICILRLAAQDTDLLVMLNDPVLIDPESSSADVPVRSEDGERLFAQVVRSFRIVDWELFGGS